MKIRIVLLSLTVSLASCLQTENCIYPRTYHFGNDIGDGHEVPLHSCWEKCKSNAKCVGATHDKEGKCYQHHKVEVKNLRNADSSYSLFVKNCFAAESESCIYQSTVHMGQDILDGFATSEDGCFNKCNIEKACKGASFDSKKKCWMHKGINKQKVIYVPPPASLFVKECFPETQPITCEHQYPLPNQVRNFTKQPDANAVLFTDFKFPASGKVAGWNFFTLRDDTNIYASVWRHLGSTRYQLVGRNRLPRGPKGLNEFIVADEDRISVQRGDFFGIHYDTFYNWDWVFKQSHTSIPYAQSPDNKCTADGKCLESDSDLSRTYIVHRHEEQLTHKPNYVIDLQRVQEKVIVKFMAPALKPILCADSGANLPTKPTEPAPVPTEPATEATEPATEATEPATEATEPATEATEPATEATEPATEATEPATEATEPATEATEPATEATEPATEATKPATEATEPATEATEPATEATEPATEATEPATEATEPATEATEPATEATEPATEATEPATEATEPATEATEPATEATEPATEATEPATEATEPVTEATAPATEATEPATEATEPVTEATEPATEATEPATEATEPATEATEPATEATEPATEATEPAPTTPSVPPCHIPFEYKGVHYDTCIKKGSAEFWCATEESYSGNSWRNCQAGDPIPDDMPCLYPFNFESAAQESCVDDGPRAWCAVTGEYNGENWKFCKFGDTFKEELPCHFPFEYKEKQVSQCIEENAAKPWCSTVPVYDYKKDWRYCRKVELMQVHGTDVGSVEEAAKACKENNMVLALRRDAEATYNMGNENCQCGWVADGVAVQVVHTPRAECGDGQSAGVHDCSSGQYAPFCV